jgi:hypothetical protein
LTLRSTSLNFNLCLRSRATIAALNDEDLRTVIGLLCEAELRHANLPVSAVIIDVKAQRLRRLVEIGAVNEQRQLVPKAKFQLPRNRFRVTELIGFAGFSRLLFGDGYSRCGHLHRTQCPPKRRRGAMRETRIPTRSQAGTLFGHGRFAGCFFPEVIQAAESNIDFHQFPFDLNTLFRPYAML